MERRLNLIEAVRSQGGRLTRQRQLVLEILAESQGHLDAETVYARAREREARIGLATVYRTLVFLKKVGLVVEHQFGEDHGHFEAVQEDRPHYHFTCLRCGQVVEFRSPQVMDLANNLCESQGLQVLEVELHFSGYCSLCRPPGTNCE